MNQTQRIAHEAARRLREGKAHDIADAIRGAVGHLRLRDADLPSHALVRQVTQAMQQAEFGAEAYAESVQARDRQLIDVMELLAQALDAYVTVAGRAARGEFDADPARTFASSRTGASAPPQPRSSLQAGTSPSSPRSRRPSAAVTSFTLRGRGLR